MLSDVIVNDRTLDAPNLGFHVDNYWRRAGYSRFPVAESSVASDQRSRTCMKFVLESIDP